MALGTVSGLGREFWPHRRNPGPTQKERVSLSLLLQRAGQPAHREEAGPVMWLELGRLGQEAESGRPPGERLEVEHMRFSVSAPTDPQVAWGLEYSSWRPGLEQPEREILTMGRRDVIPKKTVLNPKLSLSLGDGTLKAGFPLFGKAGGVHYRQLFPSLAAAKSLQLCPTLCDPIDGNPPGSSVSGILQTRILEWVAISFSNACTHSKSLQLCPTLCDPMDSSPPGSSVHRIL